MRTARGSRREFGSSESHTLAPLACRRRTRSSRLATSSRNDVARASSSARRSIMVASRRSRRCGRRPETGGWRRPEGREEVVGIVREQVDAAAIGRPRDPVAAAVVPPPRRPRPGPAVAAEPAPIAREEIREHALIGAAPVEARRPRRERREHQRVERAVVASRLQHAEDRACPGGSSGRTPSRSRPPCVRRPRVRPASPRHAARRCALERNVRENVPYSVTVTIPKMPSATITSISVKPAGPRVVTRCAARSR